jgi:hypothetical protein
MRIAPIPNAQYRRHNDMSDRGYKALSLELQAKSLMVTVEAMKVANDASNGVPQAYPEESFNIVAEGLAALSKEAYDLA